MLSLGTYEGDLVAGGGFAIAGGTSCSNLARWDGGAWSPFGSGVSYSVPVGGVSALAEHEGSLFVGGYFNQTGDKRAVNFGRWTGLHPSTVPSDPAGATQSASLFARGMVPNPSRTTARPVFEFPEATDARVSILDVSGRKVRTFEEARFSAGAHDIEWDSRDDHGVRIGSGVFFVRIETPGGVAAKRFVHVNGD